MGNGALSFLAGMGTGALTQKRRQEEDARVSEDRAMRKQEFDARMDEVNQGKKLRVSLADATTPAAVTEDTTHVLPPDKMGPSLTQYKVKGAGLDQTFDDKAMADKAAQDYSAPDAVSKRQADAYRSNGAPEKALSLENATLTQKRNKLQYDDEISKHAKMLDEEGAFLAARALRGGDAAGFMSAFNSGGKHQIEGEPVITKEEREIPDIGKVPTFTAKFKMKRPDGTVTEETRNSHDLSMQLLPFERQMDLMRKGTDSVNKANFQNGMMDAKIKQLELAGQLAEARALKSAAGGGPIGREERLRYTSLFGDAGRRMGEAQRALGSLQKDPLFMMNARKPGTPEAGQLGDLQDSIKTFGEERTLYQGLLAGSQTGGKQPSLADANPSTGETKVSPATQAARDTERMPILQQELTAAQQRLAQGDPRAKGDVEALTREIGLAGAAPRSQGTKPQPASAGSAKPNYSNLWK